MFISNDIRYIGVNDHQVTLFEGQYDVPLGMAYNSYVILDEKIAVMDTVDAHFGKEWLALHLLHLLLCDGEGLRRCLLGRDFFIFGFFRYRGGGLLLRLLGGDILFLLVAHCISFSFGGSSCFPNIRVRLSAK